MATFSLAGRGLKLNEAADIEPLLADLDTAAVKEIILSGNTLGVAASRCLAQRISQCPQLTTVDFSDIFTGRLITEIPDALKSLCDSFIGLKYLEQVNLSDNAFGGRSVEPLVDFLTSSFATLKVLKLNNNGMGPQGGTVVAQALIDSALNARKQGKKSVLEVVVCGRNRLENGSAPTWAKAFALHGESIREVRMFQNGIRMQGIQHLSRGLSQCPNLRVLDLQDNTASLSGSRAIAKAMPKWANLEDLNLNDLLLRPKGAALICQALVDGACSKIQALRVQSDEVDASAIKLLATAAQTHCKTLQAVEINGNRCDCDDEAVVALREALETNGFTDAIDEIDDVEEVDEDEEEAEEEEIESEEEELEAEVVIGSTKEPAENVRASEADVIKQDKLDEQREPNITKKDQKDSDDLANLLSSVKLQ